ncbi:MAG TPA: hypothetical protein VHA74_04025, partial [Candidatus Dojkabacteria bacterium]|nr:hypothetical protein [Candidatus Dojkabacteria bacterium]
SYYIVVPVSTNGIALLGDQNKFVSLGKKRVSNLEINDTIKTSIIFTKEEKVITLFGYAKQLPKILAKNGSVKDLSYNKESKLFTVTIIKGKTNQDNLVIN